MTPVLEHQERHVAPPLWRNPSFQLLWTSTAAAGFGDRMIELAAIPMLVAAAGAAATTGASADVGPATAAVYFWFFLPWIIITPLGGWLADTLPRKWLLLACDHGRALILLTAFLLVPAGLKSTSEEIHLPVDQHWKVYFILLGIGALAAIFSPTRNAIVPQLVPPAKLNSANSILVGIGVVASLIGYLGGHILEAQSVRTGLLVAFLAYGVSGFMFIFMRPKPHVGLDTERHHSQWQRFVSALRYILAHRPVRELVLLYTLIWSMAMIVAPAVGSLCLMKYGYGPDDFLQPFIYLNMSMGAGMMMAGVILSVLNLRRGANILMLAAIAVTGVVVALLAVQPWYALALVLCGLLGMLGGIGMISISTITQQIVPNYILGRVCGVRETLSNFASVLVNLAVWQLPHLEKVSRHGTSADKLLVQSLLPLAAIMIAVGGWNLRQVLRNYVPSSRTPSRT